MPILPYSFRYIAVWEQRAQSYQSIALDWQEELVEAVQQGETVEKVAEATESLPSGGLDERTIARLVRGWNERLIQLEAGVWSRLLEWVPPMPLSRAPSLWSMLRHAWQTVRERIPAFRNISFLHGLNRLCFSMTVAEHGSMTTEVVLLMMEAMIHNGMKGVPGPFHSQKEEFIAVDSST